MERSDLEREQAIEELREIALAQHAQLKLLMELVEKQRRELGRSRSRGDFQLTLKMLEEPEAVASRRGLTVEEVAPAALLRAREAAKAEAVPAGVSE